MPQPLQNLSIVQVTFWQEYMGQTLLNTLHYQYDSGATAPDYGPEMTALIASVSDPGSIAPAMSACCQQEWSLFRISAQPVYPVRLAARFTTVGSIGLRMGIASPPNVCATITKKTDFATRWGIGSWHQGGLGVADVQSGVLSAGIQPLLSTLGSELLVVRNGTTNFTMYPCLWNLTNPNRVTPINARELQTTTRVMRRRTVRVGI